VWRKISPDSVSALTSMQVITVSSGSRYIMALSDTVLIYSSDNSQTWITRPSFFMQCIFPPQVDYSKFKFHGATISDNGFLYTSSDGGDCSNPDGEITNLFEVKLSDTSRRKNLMLNSCSFGPVNSKIFQHKKELWLLKENFIYVFDTINSVNYYRLQAKREIRGPYSQCNPYNTKIFSADPRYDSTLFISFRTSEEIDGKYFYKDNLYRKADEDSAWKVIATAPLHDVDYNLSGGFHQLAFPSIDPNMIMIASEAGLLRYNQGSKHMDTVFQNPITSIAFSADARYAFAGDKDGKFYYSRNYGFSWNAYPEYSFSSAILDIYSDDFPSKPIYALTEDGVWEIDANLPLSINDNPLSEKELSITPNPANTSLKISSLKAEFPQQLSIINSLGQVVFKTEFSGEFVWDFKNEIPDGMYTVAVQSRGNSIAKQVLVVK